MQAFRRIMEQSGTWRIGRIALSLALLASIALGGLRPTYGQGDTGNAGDTPSAPRVISAFPAQREIVGPESTIRIVFDTPMNRASVESAFRLEPAADGALAWADDSTLTFTPGGPLKRGELYTVSISAAASSATGVPLEEPFRLTFQVTPNLTVSQVIPASGATEVEARAAITVVFDRPVVPLVVTGQQADLPQPLSFDPPVEGKGEWVGTSIYQFQPTKPLAGGTLYTVTVAGDLRDVDGTPIAEPYAWQFRTIEPQILSISPSYSGVDINSEILVSFNQPMDAASLREAFSLRNAASGANVAGTLTLESENSVLRFKPASPLTLETSYQITVLGTARSASGQATLRNPQTVTFTTVPYPRVVRSFPTNGERVSVGTSAAVEYSAPMDRDSFKGRVKVDPPVEKLTLSPSGNYLYISFEMRPAVTYTITIEAGVTDVYGNPVNEPFTFSFTTNDLEPTLNIARRDAVMFTNAYRPSTAILASAANINQIDVRLAALELPELQSLTTDYGSLSLYNYTPPRITRSWSVPVDVPRNTRADLTIPLAEDGGKLAPGIYYVDLFSPQFLRLFQNNVQEPVRAIVVVATANLTMKQSPNAVMVWATDLKSGAPLANATITLYAGRSAIGTAQTDANGLATINAPNNLTDSRTLWAVATGEGIFSVTNSGWRTGELEPYTFNVMPDYQPVRTAAYLYTDQPIYRPDRPMYFRGVLRTQDDVQFGVPSGEPVRVIINSPDGQEVYNKPLTLNAFGAFSDQWQIPAGATLGSYTLRVIFRGTENNLFFSVAEFRPPEFLVTAAADKAEYAAGDVIRVTLDGKFLFGGPVSGAQVNWTAVANTTFFNYTGEGNYDFGESPIGWWYFREGGPGWVYNRQVASGSGTLDAQGQLVIEVPADLAGSLRPEEFTIEATVTDISNQSISGRTNVTVHPAEVYIGVGPSSYVGRTGEALNINLIAVDWASQPRPEQAITLKITRRGWEQDPTTFQWRETRTPITEATLTTGPDGKATYSFTPDSPGTYEIEATGRDSRERLARTVTTVWVQGRGGYRWATDDKRVTMVADRKGQYKAGETATILITSPFPEPVKALITLERAGVMKSEVVDIEGSYTYELPIERLHAPNVYVAVAIMRGSGAGTDDGSITPELRYGLLNLEVLVEQQLKVTLTPSTARAEPGKEVTFDVLTTDLNDEPVAAEVGLHLSDVATLSIGAANSGPIFDAFWFTRGLSVLTTTALSKLIDDLTFKDIYLRNDQLMDAAMAAQPTGTAGVLPGTGGGAVPPAPGEAAAESDGARRADKGAAAAPTPRTNFVDTPLWKADLVTDASGRGQIRVTLPDNLTTWRLDARAISQETYVGQATLEIMSTKPLLVRPATPRFFVAGDETELAVVVNNNTPDDLTVQVALNAKGVILRADGQQTVSIPKDGRVRVTWLATVQDVDAVDLAFSAVSGEYSDASKPAVGIGDERLLPVYNYVAPDFVATAGSLRQPGERTEGIVVPGDAESGELTIKLQPSLAAVTLDGLTFLRNYPYQCVEQTVSRFLPNIVTYRALQKLGLDKPELRADLEAAVAFALDKLKREQKPDGGWGWYYLDQSNLLVTAYAVFGLVEARDADLLVDREMLDRALAFILSQMPSVGDQTDAYVLNRLAFVQFVLARAGSANVPLMNEIFTRREKMNLYGRALLAQAYKLTNDDQDRITTLLSDLVTAAIVSGTGIHWEESYRDWWNWGSNTRTTAIVLDTLVKLTPNSELIPNVVRWLMVARRGDAWETTQETAWAVMALTNWMDVSGELKADYTFRVDVNGKELGTGQANAETLRDTTTLQVAVADLLRDQVNRLTFDHEAGPGALYYTAALHVDLPVESIEPTNRGLAFTRTYLIDGKPVTEAKVGDVITVSLEITAANDLYYVVINDPLPAGTEAIDRSLQTSSQVGQQPELTALDADNPYGRGWGWWWFSSTELRTEKVVLSATYLPRGTYRYVYQVQATTPGTFRVIPPHGFEFYFPEVFGRGAGSLFVVKP